MDTQFGSKLFNPKVERHFELISLLSSKLWIFNSHPCYAEMNLKISGHSKCCDSFLMPSTTSMSF